MDKLVDILSSIKNKDFSYYVKFTEGPMVLVIKLNDGSFLELIEKKSCEHIKQNPKK